MGPGWMVKHTCFGGWRDFCMGPGGRHGGSGQPKGFEEVFVGSQLDTTGGIFVRACMQYGNTAFDYAKSRGHEDTTVRDRGRVKARRRQAIV